MGPMPRAPHDKPPAAWGYIHPAAIRPGRGERASGGSPRERIRDAAEGSGGRRLRAPAGAGSLERLAAEGADEAGAVGGGGHAGELALRVDQSASNAEPRGDVGVVRLVEEEFQ